MLKLDELPQEVIASMPHRDWCISAWHASVDGILSGRPRVLSTNNGIWTVACDTAEDMARLTADSEIVRRLDRYRELRPLPAFCAFSPVPATVTGAQARLHRSLLSAFSHSAPDRIRSRQSAANLSMLRQLHLENLPQHIWHAHAWRIAVGPELSESTYVLRIDRGVWYIACRTRTAYDALGTPAPYIAMLRWLSRYKKIDIVKIERLIGTEIG